MPRSSCKVRRGTVNFSGKDKLLIHMARCGGLKDSAEEMRNV
jgi:hypothetical protein